MTLMLYLTLQFISDKSHRIPLDDMPLVWPPDLSGTFGGVVPGQEMPQQFYYIYFSQGIYIQFAGDILDEHIYIHKLY